MIGAPINASLSPNAEFDDVIRALHAFFSPRRWVSGNARSTVERAFSKLLSTRMVITFNSGRSALYMLLRAFGIGKGDEVLVQAFTCVAVPNCVLWTGAKPVFVDIDDSLNISVQDASKHVSKKTKAIIVQHTLGVPADMDPIIAFAKKNGILVIEDCAHALGATYNGKRVGTLGDASIFSFGRDKVISSVFGGLAVVSPTHAEVFSTLKLLHDSLPYPNGFWILQQLLHPIAFWFILPWYRLGLGKIFLVLLQRFRLLGFPVYPEEKKGKRPLVFPAKYPNALAMLLVGQLKKLERYNASRRQVARYYDEVLRKSRKSPELPQIGQGSIYLRYPVLMSHPEQIRRTARKRGILLGNWYASIIDPVGVDFRAIGYVRGSCPNAESVASKILNLPTLITLKQARKVAKEFL